MQKTILILLSTLALMSCTSSTQVLSINDETEASWRLFCDARGYNAADRNAEMENEYLDTWCGSIEEENALNALNIL